MSEPRAKGEMVSTRVTRLDIASATVTHSSASILCRCGKMFQGAGKGVRASDAARRRAAAHAVRCKATS